MSLPELSIKRPVFATVILAALILMGIVNYGKMNVDEMPDTSLPYVSVSITYEGAQPDQVDAQVTQKVEEVIGEARGVKHIESTSREGEAEINVEFNFGIDPAAAAQEVRDKVSAIRGELPDTVKEPVISRFDMNAQPVVSIALTSETASLREISIFVEDVLKPRLQKINGVGQVAISGRQEREMAMAVAFIFMILAAQFESYSEPFAIMFPLPLAMIGALAGLFIAGSELSLVSLIGIMMLMGLVTKNAILLIDFAKQRIKAGVPCKEALAEAGGIRLRPILMTSIAMIFGMLPIALGMGPGAEARAPMAHAIIGGVLTSTLLTLVVVPTIYDLLHQWRQQEENR